MPTKRQTEQIKEVLDRGVEAVYPSRAALERRLLKGPKLTLYNGIDPTGEDLHIGHTVVLQKLRQFQKLGHKVILLIGDFTGQTGDPTDKQATRQPLTKRQVLANAKKYKEQAGKVLKLTGPNAAEIRYNSKWLEKLSFAEVADLANHFTVQQLIERDMFEQRLKAGKPISLREMLYPLMQGYDSVAMKVDLEVGGTDQTFNMLAGRKLAKELLWKDKFVLTVPLLADSQGVKIGKTEGNAIAIADPPEELYGKVMSLPDEVIVSALEWCTSVPASEVAATAKLVKSNPRDAKMKLARAIVTEYQGKDAAKRAEAHFVKVFQKHELPDAPVWKPGQRTMKARAALKESGLATSSSEAQRFIEQGAFKVDGQSFTDPQGELTLAKGMILQAGKKRSVKIAG